MTLDYALTYAKAGLPVLPLSGKKPITEHGVKDASTDPEQIRRWWRRLGLNVGVAVPEGYAVIDIDPRNGGLEAARDLGIALGGLPATARVRTGSGGWHIWLRVRCRAKELRATLGDGIDVKKAGGYVVMPPSLHPMTNRPYVWHTKAPVTGAPPAGDRALRKPPANVTRTPFRGLRAGSLPGIELRTRADVERSLRRLASTEKAARDTTLFAVGASIRDGVGLTPELERMLLDAATASGLGEERALRTIRSIKDGNGSR